MLTLLTHLTQSTSEPPITPITSHILIPPAVWEEVTIQGIGLPGALEVSQATWLSIQSPPPQLVSSLQLSIDKRESAITTSNHFLKLDVQVLIVKIPPHLRASGVQ